jgi:DNA-binding transcriptional regulator YhcF (GntR family)
VTITKQIFEVNTQLEEFISQCDQLGFKNNNSLKSMKFDWCKDQGGAWFATFVNNEMISISGIHLFEDGYRALFRGAQLYSRDIGLNRYHMQSYCFSEQLPLQIDFAKEKPIYITTNIDNDASGRMNAVNKMFYHLARYEIVEFVREDEIFYVQQNIWKLNTERYNEIRYRS